MKPYYQDENVVLHHGDCIETMRTMPDNSIDSIVTDPPYGLGFMGKKWDSLPPGEEWARECLRVLKPGGHLLAFGGSRTWHRLAVAIEDAGFEIRDGVLWLYGSGFPKSHDVSKAIDKMAGAEREVIGFRPKVNNSVASRQHHGTTEDGRTIDGRDAEKAAAYQARGGFDLTAPATDAAREWEGWGTALKPAYEPAVMARKPFAGTVAGNVLEHGTGAINIDASRIPTDDKLGGGGATTSVSEGWDRPFRHDPEAIARLAEDTKTKIAKAEAQGRFPANLILDEHTAGLLDAQSGTSKSSVGKPRSAAKPSPGWGMTKVGREHNDEGGASRFFYVAKAPKFERPVVDGVAHATVKPLKLMRYLVRMVTPPGGTVLEPFAGSGTTIEAALMEGYNVIGIERETDYLPLIQHRINRANGGKP